MGEDTTRPARIGIVGNLNIDLLMGPVPGFPAFGHEIFVPDRRLQSAGQGLYAALALAALGEPPVLLGDLGDDFFSEQIARDALAGNVSLAHVRVCPGAPTGISLAILDRHGDRAFITHPGHLGLLDLTSVEERWSAIRRTEMLLLCGYFCLPGLRPGGGTAILQRARREGIRTVLDTGWDPGEWVQGRDEVRAMLAHTDLFLPNLEEARALTGEMEPEAAAAMLLSWGAGATVIKLGPDGALVADGRHREHIPAIATRVVDTVGAGDTFDAGLLYGLLRGDSLAGATRKGCAAAAHYIAAREPRFATRVHIDTLLGSTTTV